MKSSRPVLLLLLLFLLPLSASGFFVNGGLTVLQARLWTALPHVGVGFFF